MTQISFYFDEMMQRAAARQLAQRGYNVIFANDVGMTQKSDDEHLEYATRHESLLVTLDQHFAGRILYSDVKHAGLICWTREMDVGAMVRALATFAEQHTPEQVAGRVFWLK